MKPNNKLRNDKIVALRMSGMFCSNIAKELGLTRNLVIGVCNRAGVVMKDQVASQLKNMPRGEQKTNSVLSENVVREIRQMRTLGTTFSSMGRQFGVNRSTIRDVFIRKSWAHVE